MESLRVHAATHVGLVHETNEDSWSVFPTPDGLLLAVCDGMGGMGRGDEASALAIRVLAQQLENAASGAPIDRLEAALIEADLEVRHVLCDGRQGMPGSTAVVVLVANGLAWVGWVGDSRAYLVRDGQVVERTTDHKLVEELVAAGQLTAEEAKFSTLAHVVTRAIGGRGTSEPAVQPSVIVQPWKLQQGDKIMLCSDGVCDLIEDLEVGEILADRNPDEVTSRLVELSLQRGGHDNITTIAAEWVGPSYKEDEASTPVMQAPRAMQDISLATDWTTDEAPWTEEIDDETTEPSPEPPLVNDTLETEEIRRPVSDPPEVSLPWIWVAGAAALAVFSVGVGLAVILL